jgi:hypothetical protein
VWTAVIVVLPPRLQNLFHVVERSKLIHVQTLITQSTIKRLDHSVLGGFAGSDEVELYASEITPLVERFGRKFRSVVYSYRKG